MKKIFSIIFIGLLLFCLSLGFISSLNTNINSSSKVSSDVNSILKNQESVRVFINLNNNSDGLTKQIQSMEIKNKIKSKLGSLKILGDFGSSISAELTQEDLNDLENNSNVKSITRIGIKHLLLQDSVPLINATKSWTLQMNSLNLTGRGQAVCIIDTGVSYSHPDLGGCFGNNNQFSSCKIIGGWNTVANNNNITDLDGHGTHVSGIVAANGTINGVAPGVQIVFLKAFNDSEGGFYDDDLIEAINWCVNNASKFNISVISMSLGGDYNFTSYCDASDIEDSNLFASSINAATAKNISVVIAAGNSGNYTGISSPACIQNAIPVGWSSKSDIISSFSNRNFMVQLFAPGTGINSTILSGGYSGNTWSGTSMSTPHVAGAIAILNQYLKLSSQTKTPGQIESTLNSTGKQLFDASSGLNFSRINLYNAILSIDNQAPNVSLIFPQNNILNGTLNQTFICNASDWQLNNMTLYIWNSSGSLFFNETKNITGFSNQTTFNVFGLNGNYKWNCLASDLKNNKAYSISNNSLTAFLLTVTLNSPINNNFTNLSFNFFNCSTETSSSSLLKNITFYLWNSSNGLVKNETKILNGTSNSSVFNFTFISEDNYKWNCLSFNNNSNFSWASLNNTITYDKTSPIISLISPDNSSSYTDANLISFSYNLSENFNISNCSLIVNNEINSSNSEIINFTSIQYFSNSFSVGDYVWQINCSDLAGNKNFSDIRNFTVTPAPSLPSGGSGGGGNRIISNVWNIADSQLLEGYTQSLAKGDKINFNLQYSNSHSLIVNFVNSNFTNITIFSAPLNIVLGLGEELKLNLSSNDYYDVYIKLNSVVNNKINMTLKSIYELMQPINKISQSEILNNTKNQVEIPVQSNKNNYIMVFVIIIVVIIVFFVILYIIKTNKSNKKKK